MAIGASAAASAQQLNERSGTALNRVQYPSDVVVLVVLWRVRYELGLRDLPEMFLVRGMVFSHEAFAPALAEGTPSQAARQGGPELVCR